MSKEKAARATTTAGSTGILSTITTSLAHQVAAMVMAGLIVAGAGVGGYYAVARIALAKKEVPSVIGLKKEDATRKIEQSGLKCRFAYSLKIKTGDEVVTEQSAKPGTKLDKGSTFSLTLSDEVVAQALGQAQQKLGEANSALADVQGMGIDTADLAQPIQNAQARHDNAKTVEDLIGPSDSSVFWSDTVISACSSKKQAYLADAQRQEERTYSDEEAAARDDAGWWGSNPESNAPFFTVIIASLDQRTGHTRSEGEKIASELREKGFPAGVLDSNSFGSLRRPYWVVYSGMYDSEAYAKQALSRLKSAGYGSGYVRYVAIEGPGEVGPIEP